MASESRGLLVIDLDGTLCLGDAPVRAFARFAEEETGASGIVAGLDEFLAGTSELAVRDGYQAVFALARERGAGEVEALSAAFRRTRTGMAEWIDEVRAPEGAAELLGSLTRVHRVLVTNSPPDNLGLLLRALGVHRVLDGIVTNAKKPRKMPAVLDGLQLATPGVPLASLGDIWENDHADVHARGGATFVVDRYGRGDGEPTARSSEIAGLYDPIRSWAEALD